MSSIERFMAKKAEAERQKAAELEAQKQQQSDSADVDNTEALTHQSTHQTAKSESDNQQILSAKAAYVQTTDVVKLTENLSIKDWPILDNNSPIAEQFSDIKHNLYKSVFGPIGKWQPQGNVIAITSANPEEGKSFCAMNLALSIATEQDKNVILIDCDFQKPTLHTICKMPADDGLSDYLKGRIDAVSSIVKDTDIEKLKIVPAGRQFNDYSTLLNSDKLKKLVIELSELCVDGVIILDTPSIFNVDDSSVIMDTCGHILVVVEEGKTPLEQVKRITNLLPMNVTKAFVLNRVISDIRH